MKVSSMLRLAPFLALATALVIPHDFGELSVFTKIVATTPDTSSSDTARGMAPLVASEVAAQNIVPDSFIVVFKKNVDPAALAQHMLLVENLHRAKVEELGSTHDQHPLVMGPSGLVHQFSIGPEFNGYTGKFHESVVEAIRSSDLVEYVERDSVVKTQEFGVEQDSPWGLSRISHRQPLSLGTFNKYLYDIEAGAGVTCYVIDTGTNIEHEDFEGRAKWGKTIPEGDEDIDGNGHGTHCSGTIAGRQYGVAKKANVVAVKVLRSNGSGSMSDVLKGVEWAATAHLAAVKEGKKGFKGSTANMSLGGGKSPSLNLAVNAAVRAGLHFAVAAGNDNADACNYSPASAVDAVTVGASSLEDDRAYFSNKGSCVDVFAPGVNILSTYKGHKKALAVLSGTSMASPHIAGLLSYYLSLQPDTDSEFATLGAVTPSQMKKNLIRFATQNVLAGVPEDTPNLLAFNGAGSSNLSEFWAQSRSEPAVTNTQASLEEALKESFAEAWKFAHEVERKSSFTILPIEGYVKEGVDRVSAKSNALISKLRDALTLPVFMGFR